MYNYNVYSCQNSSQSYKKYAEHNVFVDYLKVSKNMIKYKNKENQSPSYSQVNRNVYDLYCFYS
jgi:hypothetical protein